MKKTIATIGIAGTLLVGGVSAPILPEDMEWQFAYQIPYGDQFISNESATTTPEESSLFFKDKDKNGVVSVAVFKNARNEYVYEQIPDAQYHRMGLVDGKKDNPKRNEFRSFISGKVARAAIARDGFTDIQQITATSITFSHTNGAIDNTLLLCGSISDTTVTGVTYNGVSMTSSGVSMTDDASRIHRWWRLVAPATGSNNVVMSLSSSATIRGTCASYTGVDQTTPIDASGKGEGLTGTTPSISITSTVSDTWGVALFRNTDAAPTDGTLDIRAVSNSLGLADTNASLGGTGSETLSMTVTGGDSYLTGLLIAPAAVATSNAGAAAMIGSTF